ncbi:MAG: hypothetical protein ACR2MS_01365 [Weeksellaceae bacterium]
MKNFVFYIAIISVMSSCEKPAPQKPKEIYNGKEEIKQKLDTTIKPITIDSIKIDSLDATENSR